MAAFYPRGILCCRAKALLFFTFRHTRSIKFLMSEITTKQSFQTENLSIYASMQKIWPIRLEKKIELERAFYLIPLLAFPFILVSAGEDRSGDSPIADRGLDATGLVVTSGDN